MFTETRWTVTSYDMGTDEEIAADTTEEVTEQSACTCGCSCEECVGKSRHFHKRPHGRHNWESKQKTELLANCVTIDLPDYFYQARNSGKTVGIECVTVLQKHHGKWEPVPNCTVHSDSFARTNANYDFYICQGNYSYHSTPRVFVIGDAEATFRFWLRDSSGDDMEMYPTRTKVIMELILRY